jgi:hypothetical protein
MEAPVAPIIGAISPTTLAVSGGVQSQEPSSTNWPLAAIAPSE